MSNALPTNTPTAAATPSPSSNFARDLRGRAHAAAVAIFFVCGLAALSPSVWVEIAAAGGPGSYIAGTPFLLRTLTLPGASFVVAMMCAGALVRGLGLLPGGISFSAARTMLGALVGLVAYPAGFLAIVLQVWLLFAWSKERAPGARGEVFELVVGYAILAGMLFVGAVVTLLILTTAFALVARYWPPRAFRTIAVLIGVTILASPVASFLHFLVYLHRPPIRSRC